MDPVDAAIRAIPAQTKEHAHKDCRELPLGNRSPDARELGDFPAGPDILGAANTPLADIRRRRFRAVGDLARIVVPQEGGIEHEFIFKDWRWDAPVPRDWFVFEPPRGVVIVDGLLPSTRGVRQQ